MRVIRAQVLGFCMGVRRAVDLARAEAARPGRVYTMGPLIHNPEVMESLRQAGVEILQEDRLPEDLSGAAVIIRAHGIRPALEEELQRRGARIVDATCPRVKANQIKARALGAAACTVFLAGEQDHGEVAGLRGYGGPSCVVVSSPAEAAAAAEELARRTPQARTALIAQTTIAEGEYAAIAEEIRHRFPDLEVIKSICGATRDRQESLRDLCAQTEAVIIAGGRDSSNTRRLLALAEGLGKKAWLVENAGDIPPEAASFPRIGLSAGASTPDETLDEIEKVLRSW